MEKNVVKYSGNGLVKKPDIGVYTDAIKKYGVSFGKLLPAHMGVGRFQRIALRAIGKNPGIMSCSKESVLSSLLLAAELGLEPSGALGSAYLVPFGQTCTLITGYRGLIDLARRSGKIKKIEAHLVYENDQFEYQLGSNPNIKHLPNLKDRGAIIAAYAIATLEDGESQFDIMNKEEIDAIRKRSKASGSGPWVTDYGEMAKKTVARRLCKYLPMSIELATAVELDNRAETGEGVTDLIGLEDDEIKDIEQKRSIAVEPDEDHLAPEATKTVGEKPKRTRRTKEEMIEDLRQTLIKNIQAAATALPHDDYILLLSNHGYEDPYSESPERLEGLLRIINAAVDAKNAE